MAPGHQSGGLGKLHTFGRISLQTQEEFFYEKRHPCLYEKLEPRSKMGVLLKPLEVALVAARVGLWFCFILLNTLTSALCDLGSDKTRPLSPARYRAYRFFCAFWSRMVLFSFGYLRLRVHGTPQDAPIWIAPHRSAMDVLIDNIFGTAGFVAKKAMAQNPIVMASIKATRSLAVGDGGLVEQLKTRVGSGGWPSMTVFAEGTCCVQNVMLRLRTGVFRIGCAIQPFVYRYNSKRRVEWLEQSILRHLCDCCSSSCWSLPSIDVIYLDKVTPLDGESPREFADRVGRKMAEAVGAAYVPYQQQDVKYFLGQSPRDKCTPEYLRDFGWMGTRENYCKLCARKNLDPTIQWSQSQLE